MLFQHLYPITILLFLLLHSITSTTTTDHSDNWAVIVSTSKYWFNYRHNSDALTLYHLVKERGIPDSNIILMLPEDVACTPKNVIPATVYNTPYSFPKHQKDLYNVNNYDIDHDINNLYDESQIEIDYKGDDVTVENFLRVLTGRHEPNTPRNKRLLSNKQSNLFIYISGHGGDQFLKFRDTEILTAQDLSYAIKELDVQQRFHTTYLLVETCQAATLVEGITTPNVITSASSIRGENSYSHGVDYTIGASIVDKFTYFLHQLYIKTKKFSNISMGQYLQSFPYSQLRSTHHVRTELYEYDQTTGEKIRDVNDISVLSFFGASLRVVDTKLYQPSFNYDIIQQFNNKMNSKKLNDNKILLSKQQQEQQQQELQQSQSNNNMNQRNDIEELYQLQLKQNQTKQDNDKKQLAILYLIAIAFTTLQVYLSLFRS